MITDEQAVRVRAHSESIARYRRLLETRLSDLERHFIQRRLTEEQSALSGIKKVIHPPPAGAVESR